jgi:MSHA pilin protein MshD
MWNKRSAGVTLVELVVAIVIIGIALAGMVAAFTRGDRASADPVVNQQMAVVAEGLMEEILLKPFGPKTGAAKRIDFATVGDYEGYAAAGIVDIEGTAVPGLGEYSVKVTVRNVTLPGLTAGDTAAVSVSVTNTNMRNGFTLTGWRTAP